MVKIQINLSDDEDRIVTIYKAMHRLETKERAIKSIISSLECKHKFEVSSKVKANENGKIVKYNLLKCSFCDERKLVKIK